MERGVHPIPAMETDVRKLFDGLVRRFRSEEREAPARPERPAVQLNGPAPDFEADTTHGRIQLSTWNRDRWVVLFSHPANFTPVCTTELAAFARRHEEFQKRNVALLGLSVDSVYAHIAWVRNIKEKLGVDIPFPLVADRDMKVAQLYGMIHEPSSDTAAVRALYVLDPKRTVRAIIYYPLNAGRNVDEVLRIVDALQMVDETGLAAPANWRPGEPAIVPPPKTIGEAEERAHLQGVELQDWYLARKQPRA